MQPLLLIATGLLPELIQILAGDQSGRAKEKIVAAIKNATGDDDPTEARRKVDEDTEVRAQLLKKLNTVALEEAIDQSRDREAARSMQESMERGGRVTASLTIPTKGGDFPSLELQTMLSFFRGYYCLALDYYLEDKPIRGDVIGIVEKITSSDQSTGGNDDNNDDNLKRITNNGLLEIPYPQDLFILDIKRENPIELIVAGIGAPLAAAVILSGGQYKFGPLSVTLPPIGEGIERLREALRPFSAAEIHRTRPQRLRSARSVAARRAAGSSAGARPSAGQKAE